MPDSTKIRLGKIGYLNVLPIYSPLESGAVQAEEGDLLTIVSGPPAELNDLMAAGGLDVSAVSSIEYARRSERYLLVPNLAIGSRGPVRSVLLLSRLPVDQLAGRSVLVSSQTHTSAALLRLLFKVHRPMDVTYDIGGLRSRMQSNDPPEAALAIGDDALAYRNDPRFPYQWDLGEVWRAWTGLPFLFGLWVVRRDLPQGAAMRCANLLLRAKEHGAAHMAGIIEKASSICSMSEAELRDYFGGLSYELGTEELSGLLLFYEKLTEAGELSHAPRLDFVGSGLDQDTGRRQAAAEADAEG